MDVREAQREVRKTFRGGFMGQLVSGVLWLGSAALGTWGTPRQAILLLVVGGLFIFPLTQLGLRLMGGPSGLRPDNPLGGLGMQVAFVLPLTLPVVGAAALYRLHWFYPAFMIVLGAHYLPFVFLYGMRLFAVLGALLVGLGVAIGLHAQESFSLGAWVTAGILLLFAVLGRASVRQEQSKP
jgi:hypothetical protein